MSSDEDIVELGVQFLETFEHEEVELPTLMDHLEGLTNNIGTVREILDKAERSGVIERDGKIVNMSGNQSGGGGVLRRFEPETIKKKGEFSCKRCNASISTGYFLRLPAGEHGPFGSTCITKVTGQSRPSN